MRNLNSLFALCLVLLSPSTSGADAAVLASLKSHLVNLEPLTFPPPPPHTEFAQGVASGGVAYSLTYDPYNNSTCVKDGDADGDGFWDMAELELAWAFQPYFIFHEDEEFVKGTVVTFQAMPSIAGTTLRLRVKYVLLMPVDSKCGANHGGDTEQISFLLESEKSENPNGFFRTWRLAEISTKDKDNRNVRLDLQNYFSDPSLSSRYYLNTVSTHQDVVDSGLIHKKIFISKGKHGLYDSVSICEQTKHGCLNLVYEDCNGTGIEGFMLPGFATLVQGESRITEGVTFTCNSPYCLSMSLEWERLLQNNQNSNDQQVLHSILYLANLGEKGHLLLDGLDHWFPNEKVTNACFCGGYRYDDDTILGIGGYSDDCGNSAGGCTCDTTEGGLLDYVIPECDVDLGLVWDLNFDVIDCQLKNIDIDPDCGGSVVSKIMTPVGGIFRCSGHVPDDFDLDGVPSQIDCDDTNRFLTTDIDRDGVCDFATLNAPACQETCLLHLPDLNEYTRCRYNCWTSDNCAPPIGDPCYELTNGMVDGEISQTDSTLLSYCQLIYGNQMIRLPADDSNENVCTSTEANGKYYMVQPPGSCNPALWSHAHSRIGENDILSWRTETVTLPDGRELQKPGLYRCNVPTLETALNYSSGGYSWANPGQPFVGTVPINEEGLPETSISTRPASLMVCGCSVDDPDCETRTCPPGVDDGLSYLTSSWNPQVFEPSLERFFDETFGAVVEQPNFFRHRTLTLRPGPFSNANQSRWLDPQYDEVRSKNVKTRFSYPSRPQSFNGRTQMSLQDAEYSLANEMSPLATSRPESCRKTSASDFSIPETVEVDWDPETALQEMRPFKITPGVASMSTRFHVFRQAPSGATVPFFVQAISGSGLIAQTPSPVVNAPADLTIDAARSAKAITILTGTRNWKCLKSQGTSTTPALLVDTGTNVYLLVQSTAGWEAFSWNDWYGSDAGLPELENRVFLTPEINTLMLLGRTPSGVWEWYRGDINSGKWALARSFTFPEFVEGMTPWYEPARDRLYFFGGAPQPSIRFFHGNGFDGSLDLQQVVDLGASPQVMPSSRSDQVYILATAAQGHQILRLHLRDGLVQPIETSEGLASETPIVFYDQENQDVLVADEASEDTSISITRLNPERLDTVPEATQVQVRLAADTDSWYFPQEGLDPSPKENSVSKTSGCGCVQFGRSTVPTPTWLVWLLLGVLVLRRRSR